MVRNLRFNKTTNRIEWDNPDCTTVTGLENVTKVLLRREVDKLWNVTRFRDINTTFLILREFGFDPYIQYRVRVHVTRCYQCPENPHLYQDKQWQSNPAGEKLQSIKFTLNGINLSQLLEAKNYCVTRISSYFPLDIRIRISI